MSIARKLMGVTKGADGVSVTLDNTYFDTLTDTSFPFNYGSSIPAGTPVIVVVTARGPGPLAQRSWTSASDNAGNTYSLAVQGTQNNNLTFTAIYFCALSNSVTASTVITATTSGSIGSQGRHAAVFVLSGVSNVENTENSPADSSPVSISSTTVSGSGIAFHAVSTGLGTTSVTSVSADFVLQVESINTGCNQYIATSVFDKSPSDSVSNTFTLSDSGARCANMMAIIE